MYTTIIHPLRKALCLSINEYVILDTIYHLSNNEKYGGWCIMTKSKLADVLDVSRDTIFRILKTLKDKELIKRDEATGYVKTTDAFNELIANKHDWIIGFNGKESALLSGKINLESQNQTGGLKMQQGESQNQTGVVAKSDTYNNKDNNKDISFKKETKRESTLKKEFEKYIALYENLKNTKLKILDGRRKKFKARRKVFSYEDMILAMQNILKDPFLQGDNDQEKVYGDIDYCLRENKIEKWINPLTPIACKQNEPIALPSDEFGLPSLRKLKEQRALEKAKKDLT